jgi:hypothetical protein
LGEKKLFETETVAGSLTVGGKRKVLPDYLVQAVRERFAMALPTLTNSFFKLNFLFDKDARADPGGVAQWT